MRKDRGVKAFFIETTTNEVPNHRESFATLPGNEAIAYTYMHIAREKGWAKGPALDEEIWRAALEYGPDIIVYIGACGGNTPSPYLFERLRAHVAPTVHLCSDAGDDPWWPLLIEYERANSFSLQVALDGARNWPLADSQLTALTVINTSRFPSTIKPHSEREVVFGFAGNVTHRNPKMAHPSGSRFSMVEKLAEAGLQYRRREVGNNTYQGFVDFMVNCRMVINFPRTGTGRFMHVKGRVIETGLAGGLLLERRGSPTGTWFQRGVDFLEYETLGDACEIVKFFRDCPEATQAMGARLRAKVLSEHRPEKFWGRIFDRIGVKEAIAA
jgi:hypothetical protein